MKSLTLPIIAHGVEGLRKVTINVDAWSEIYAGTGHPGEVPEPQSTYCRVVMASGSMMTVAMSRDALVAMLAGEEEQ